MHQKMIFFPYAFVIATIVGPTVWDIMLIFLPPVSSKKSTFIILKIYFIKLTKMSEKMAIIQIKLAKKDDFR